MVPKLYDLAAADEDQRSYAIEPVRLPVNSTALTKLSAMDRHADALLLCSTAPASWHRASDVSASAPAFSS